MTHILTRRGTQRGSRPASCQPRHRAPIIGAKYASSLPNLSASDALLLRPGDRSYETYEPASNKRVLLRPKLRALCKTSKAVSVMVSGRAATI